MKKGLWYSAMITNALIADSKDSVATLTRPLIKGSFAEYETDGKIIKIQAVDDIPEYHKIAVTEIKKGDAVIKYGEIIGYAKCIIRMGEHVHTHNLSSDGR